MKGIVYLLGASLEMTSFNLSKGFMITQGKEYAR